MKAIMNKEIVEVNIKEQLAQLISKSNASPRGLRGKQSRSAGRSC